MNRRGLPAVGARGTVFRPELATCSRIATATRDPADARPLDTSLCIVEARDDLPAATRFPAPVSARGDRVTGLRMACDGHDGAYPVARRPDDQRDRAALR